MKIAKYLSASAFIAMASLAISLLVISSPAMADTRVFIIANQPDGYGIDQCLAGGERCGQPAARAYCEARDFKTASAYRRVDPDEVTGAIPASTGLKCSGRACVNEYVAITCER
jgi:hypothetical protein